MATATASATEPTTETKSKLDQCLTVLRETHEAGAELPSDYALADQVGCSRGQAQRARLAFKAQLAAARIPAADATEAERRLSDLLDAFEAEDLIRAAIEELKAEKKELEAALKERVKDTAGRRREARETFPLWEQKDESGGGSNSGIGSVDRNEGRPEGRGLRVAAGA